MTTGLIGHTGFIGGNLARQFAFDHLYNSKNIGNITGMEFDLLVCAGVTALKWWANWNPVEDRAGIDRLLDELRSVRAAKVILVSTVDVYPVCAGIDESFDVHSLPNHPYGTNRLHFEESLKDRFGRVVTARLPGVFGPGLKKNVIYDLLHDNCLDAINPESSFQYYNVERLWRDLEALDRLGIPVMNFVTEPVTTAAIVERFFAGKLIGPGSGPAVNYDIRTRFGEQLGGGPHYLADADQVLEGLEEFIRGFA